MPKIVKCSDPIFMFLVFPLIACDHVIVIGCKDLPGSLTFYNGGFSCKSFSRLHPDYVSFMKAILQDNQDRLIQDSRYLFV